MQSGVINITTKSMKSIDILGGVCYSRYMTVSKGKTFGKRSVAAKDKNKQVQANQWQATEQQLKWLEYYMDPKNTDTYGKPYHAAIKAGYSESYAKNMMSPSVALQWVQSAKNIMRSMNTEHIRNVLEEIALDRMEKASDRIAAAKLLGTDQGMFVQRTLNAHVGLEEALAELE